MKRLLNRRLLVLAALCSPSFGWAQNAQRMPAGDNNRYVLFIHAGPARPDDPIVRQILLALAKLGFLVRAPEGDLDKVGGPGVDYFDDGAREKAQLVADTVNTVLATAGFDMQSTKKLAPRKQSGKTSGTYLGVWLFDAATKIPPAQR